MKQLHNITDMVLIFAVIVMLVFATRESMRSDAIAESNQTLSRLLDEQMTLNKTKLTELEEVIDAMMHQPPRVADSLRMAFVK